MRITVPITPITTPLLPNSGRRSSLLTNRWRGFLRSSGCCRPPLPCARALSTSPARSSSTNPPDAKIDAPQASKPEKSEKTFHSSVPYYKGHLVLHSPTPSSSWPARWPLESYLARLTAKARVGGWLVNLSSSSSQDESALGKEGRGPDEPVAGSAGDAVYEGTLYRPNSAPVRLTKLDAALPLPSSMDELLPHPHPGPSSSPREAETHIYVCTHGSRDCRCGETGGAVFRAIAARVAAQAGEEGRGSGKVRVREITHVGGHVWAGNVLVYPKGDWYGKITPEDVPRLLETVLPSRETEGMERTEGTIWPEKWRGRMGLDAERTAALYASALALSASPSFGRSESEAERQKQVETVALKFKLWDGSEVSVNAPMGESLMQVCKTQAAEGEKGFEAVEGVCGGNLECATCHLYLLPSGAAYPSSPLTTPAPVGKEAGKEQRGEQALVPEMEDAEEDMLAYAIGMREGLSRLGCQVRVTRELGGWCERGGRIGVPRY